MSSSEWTEPQRLRFGDFEIHPGAARRVRHGRPIALEPRAFSLLLLLARSGGRLVEKQEILEAVWNGAFVTDNAVTRSVARLRKALDDSARVPRFIETVYSRGYRFVAPVEVIDAGADADVEPGSGAGSRRLIWIVAGLVAGLLAVALPRLLLGPAEDPRGEASRAHALDPRRIAVLPLENLSGGTEDEYFVNGLTEQIISNLAQVGGLRVLAGTTMGAFKDSPRRVGEIARELEAGTVLEGSARRSGDKLRIHAVAVMSFLNRREGIPVSVMVGRGLGSKLAVAHNTRPDGSDDPAGRARNRRVEILLATRAGVAVVDLAGLVRVDEGGIDVGGGAVTVDENGVQVGSGAIRVDEGSVRVGGVEVAPGGARAETGGAGSGGRAVDDSAPVSCEVGQVCSRTCPEGDCQMTCEPGAVCDFGCGGGDCTMRCRPGATCNLSCGGGDCLFACALGAVCNTSCGGGDCRAP